MPPFVDSSRSAPFVNRSTALSLTLAVIVLAGTLTIWTTSSTDRAPAEHPVEALDAPATVRWQSSGTASVRVATPGDAVRSLGFIHGMRKAWTMLLWRQTALGDVSGWFGPGTIRLDRHIHRLGIPHTSQRAYLRLPDSSKALLERYGGRERGLRNLGSSVSGGISVSGGFPRTVAALAHARRRAAVRMAVHDSAVHAEPTEKRRAGFASRVSERRPSPSCMAPRARTREQHRMGAHALSPHDRDAYDRDAYDRDAYDRDAYDRG